METRVGEWYLCGGYIEEPVVIEALESDRVQVRYLTTDRTRWLGYPRIWHACRPQPLSYRAEFDAHTQMVTLHPRDGVEEEPQHLSLSELRARYFPSVRKPRLVKAKKASRLAGAIYDAGIARTNDPFWKSQTEVNGSNDDEEEFALDMSM